MLLLPGGSPLAQGADCPLPAYEPEPVALQPNAGYLDEDGRVTVIGYNDMRDLLEPLASRFTSAHPHIRFRLDLRGTRHAPEALARGTSAFAPMGAEFSPDQLVDYRRFQPLDPLCFRVAHASLHPAALSGPLAVIVHRDNPIEALTLEQVSRIFAGEVRRWGELGLGGSWRNRPIVLYGLAKGTALAHAFSDRAMRGREPDPAMRGFPQSADVVERVAADDIGIGFAAAMRVSPDTRVVPLVAPGGSEPVWLTEENLAAGRYPLDRHLLVCAARPVSSLAREFLRLLLSREGQDAVAATPQGYVPLSAADAALERGKLDQSSPESSSCTSAAVSGK